MNNRSTRYLQKWKASLLSFLLAFSLTLQPMAVYATVVEADAAVEQTQAEASEAEQEASAEDAVFEEETAPEETSDEGGTSEEVSLEEETISEEEPPAQEAQPDPSEEAAAQEDLIEEEANLLSEEALYASSATATSWSNIQTLINNATDGDELTISLNSNLSAGRRDTSLTVPAGKVIVLDLQGHALNRNLTQSTTNGYVIKVDGKLTITDSLGTDAGIVRGGYDRGNGGGILVSSGGELILEHGQITGNTTSSTATSHSGTGVYVSSGASFTLSGGQISGNTSRAANAGGVYVADGGTISISGNPQIAGNTANSNASNLVVAGKIGVDGPLSDGANICISILDTAEISGGNALVMTSGLSGNGDESYFSLDNNNGTYWVKTYPEVDDELIIGAPVTISFDAGEIETTGEMDDEQVMPTIPYTLPDCSFEPVLSYAEFAGWQVGDETLQPGNEIDVAGDVEVTALWTFREWTISFDPNGGEGDPVSEVVTEGPYKLPENFFTAPEGTRFTGWIIDGDEEDVKQPEEEITILADTEVMPQWTNYYIISFDRNNERAVDATGEMASFEWLDGVAYELPESAYQSLRYVPAGWSIDGVDYEVGEEVFFTEDTVITQNWAAADKNIFVGGVQIDGDNCEDVLEDGTVSYDFATNTLTLNNARIEMSLRDDGKEQDKEFGIRYNLNIDGPFTINLIGDNAIVDEERGVGITEKYGIACYNSALAIDPSRMSNCKPIFTGGGTLTIGMATDTDTDKWVGYHGSGNPTTIDDAKVYIYMSGDGVSTGYEGNTFALKNGAHLDVSVGRNENTLAFNVNGIIDVAPGAALYAASESGLINSNYALSDQSLGGEVFVSANADGVPSHLWNHQTNLSEYKYFLLEGYQGEEHDVDPADEAFIKSKHGGQVPDGVWAVLWNEDETEIVDGTDGSYFVYSYDGTAHKPHVHVYNKRQRLVEKTDYTVSYKNNTNAYVLSYNDAEEVIVEKQTPMVILNTKGNFTTKKEVYFNILPAEFDEFSPAFTHDTMLTYVYAAKGVKAAPKVTFKNGAGKTVTMKAGKDYLITAEAIDVEEPEGAVVPGKDDAFVTLMKPGLYAITLTGQGNFEGERFIDEVWVTEKTLMSKTTIKINPKTATYRGGEPVDVEVTVSGSYKDASGKKATVTETLNAENGYLGDFFEAYLYDNSDVGTATALVIPIHEGEEHFIGEKRATFKIVGGDLSKAVFTLPKTETYTSQEITLDGKYSVTLKDGTVLEEGEDYEVSYANNIKAGKATISFIGLNAYAGKTVKKTFTIAPIDLSDHTVGEVSIDLENEGVFPYLKGGVKPIPTVEYQWRGSHGEPIFLVEGVDYKVSYSNNNAVAGKSDKKAPTITITGKGNFKGKFSDTFTIVNQTNADAEVTIVAADVLFNAKAGKWKSSPKVVDANGKTLSAGKDYDKNIVFVDEDGNILDANSHPQVGDIILMATRGLGNYADAENPEEFNIFGYYHVMETSIAKATVTLKDIDEKHPYDPKKGYEYTGEPIVPDNENMTVQLVVNKVPVELEFVTDGESDGYEIVPDSYVNNVKKGTASFMIHGTGKYGGTKKVTFKIYQRNTENWWEKVLEALGI